MNKIFQIIKITALAITLSVGLSYVYAWTAPTVTPPNGNTSAPLNSSITSQIKSGGLVIDSLGIANVAEGALNVLGGAKIAGNVGIGTTAPPVTKVEVIGTVRATSFQGDGSQLTGLSTLSGGNVNTLTKWLTSSTVGNSVVSENTSGNIGIGAIPTSDKLQVAGSMNIPSGSAYKYNGNSIARADTLGNYYFAGSGDMGNTGITGINNLAMGWGSLWGNSSGSYNIALGTYALNGYNTGSENTATGYSALSRNTIGNKNTAIGSNVLVYNDIGDSNTAVGAAAMYYNTTGSSNTAVGRAALYGNSVGNENTAIGRYSLKNYSSGSVNNNTVVGYSTLFDSTGPGNSSLGWYSGFDNTTGASSTFIGANAGRSNTTGNYNTAVGYYADFASGALTNVTAIGNSAKVNASNNMVFGNSNVIGWGFGVAPGAGNAIRVGSSITNGNGATLSLSGHWTDGSDGTKKHDIEDITYGLKEVMKLRPVNYKWNTTNQADFGFIAQDVKKILPEIVYGEEGQMSISYGQIASVLTKATQEQQKQIEELKSTNENLKARLEALEAKMK